MLMALSHTGEVNQASRYSTDVPTVKTQSRGFWVGLEIVCVPCCVVLLFTDVSLQLCKLVSDLLNGPLYMHSFTDLWGGRHTWAVWCISSDSPVCLGCCESSFKLWPAWKRGSLPSALDHLSWSCRRSLQSYVPSSRQACKIKSLQS